MSLERQSSSRKLLGFWQAKLHSLEGLTVQFELENGDTVHYCQRSLYCLHADMGFRKWLVKAALSKHLDRMVMVLIVLNSVLMMVTLSDREIAESVAVNILEEFFTWAFAVELFIKVMAMGFVLGQNSYMRSAWNMLDFIVVATAFSGSDIAIFRCLRLLRPLRTLNKFPGLKMIVQTLLHSIPSLKDLVFLAIFVFVVFAVVGLNVMSNSFWSRCRATPEPLVTGEWPPLNDGLQLCGAGFECTTTEGGNNTYCGNLIVDGGATPEQAWAEIEDDGNSYFGLLGFHNFRAAMLTVFVMATVDNWNEVMYRYMDEIGSPMACLFFFLLVILGNLFIMNLVMAILWEVFESTQSEYKAEMEKKQGEEGVESPKSAQKKNALEWHSAARAAREEFIMGFLSQSDQSHDYGDQTNKSLVLKTILTVWKTYTEEVVDTWARETFDSLEEMMRFCSLVETTQEEQNEELRQAQASAAGVPLDEYEGDDGPPQIEAPEYTSQRSDLSRVFQSKGLRRLQKMLRKIVEHRIFVGIIFVLITMNSLTLAMDRYPPPGQDMQSMIISLNEVFTAAFTIECILKICAYGFCGYIHDRWNAFDLFVVIISFLEMMIGSGGGSALSALRSCRLLRVFKLARNVLSLRILLLVLGKATVMCTNFCIVAGIFLYIFTLLGMQLFAQKLGEEGVKPPLHFDDPLNAFLSVFVIVSGEKWSLRMMQTGDALGSWTMPIAYYVMLLVVGNLVLLQLFMAILGASFGTAREGLFEMYHDKLLNLRLTHDCFRELKQEYTLAKQRKAEALERHKHEPRDDLPLETGLSILIFPLRSLCQRVLNFWLFDNFILFLIMVSTALLAVDTPYVDPSSQLRTILDGLDLFFFIVFLVEMIIKMFAFGLTKTGTGYFRSAWNWLDFIVVLISLINQFSTAELSNLRVLRALRALRPLRLIRRNKGMKTLVLALIRSIPQLANTLCISFLFFFVFAILGVNFFKAAFWHCVPYGPDSSADLDNEAACVESGGEWRRDNVNFDDIFAAMYALFQVATGAWTSVVLKARDSAGQFAILYFLLFSIVGNFVILNLFIGIIVDEMGAAKAEVEESKLIVSEEESKWYELQSRILGSVPLKKQVIIRGEDPLSRARIHCLRLVEAHKFELLIMGCILMNAAVMCVRHATMGEGTSEMIAQLNFIFAIVFTIECVLKLFALGHVYFDNAWNKFDFTIVVGTNIFLVVSAVVSDMGPIAVVLPAVRLLRVGRLLRLMRSARGLQVLFKTMAAVIPSIANVACLLLLLFYIYSILALGFFSKTMPGDIMTGRVHFRDFPSALITWAVMATGNLWDDLVWDCALVRPGCVESQSYDELMRDGPMECGTPAALPIFVSFIFLGGLVGMNLFVGVVLETFNDESKKDLGDAEEPLEQFFEMWSYLLPDASRLMPVSDLFRLLGQVSEPVGLYSAKRGEQISSVKLKRLIKFGGLGDVPLFMKKGRACVHIRDIMLIIAKRCCANATRQHMYMANQVEASAAVKFRPNIEQHFQLLFPELQKTGSILQHSGDFLEFTYTVGHDFAQRTIVSHAKQKKLYQVHRVQLKVKGRVVQKTEPDNLADKVITPPTPLKVPVKQSPPEMKHKHPEPALDVSTSKTKASKNSKEHVEPRSNVPKQQSERHSHGLKRSLTIQKVTEREDHNTGENETGGKLAEGVYLSLEQFWTRMDPRTENRLLQSALGLEDDAEATTVTDLGYQHSEGVILIQQRITVYADRINQLSDELARIGSSYEHSEFSLSPIQSGIGIESSDDGRRDLSRNGTLTLARLDNEPHTPTTMPRLQEGIALQFDRFWTHMDQQTELSVLESPIRGDRSADRSVSSSTRSSAHQQIRQQIAGYAEGIKFLSDSLAQGIFSVEEARAVIQRVDRRLLTKAGIQPPLDSLPL